MVIDDTYIEISAPKINPGKYYNYKGYYSLNWLMGCDVKCRFRFVYGPVYGSTNDAFIFRLSGLKDWLETQVPSGYHIIGDGAYPLLPNLLRPHKGSLNDKQKIYNRRLCKQRRKIEIAFGLFKNRFRKFRNCVVNGENKFNVKVFIAELVIHNILIN